MKIFKKKYLFYGIIPVLLGLGGLSAASAHGIFGWRGQADPASMATEQAQRFEQLAEVLGISVDQVKDYWAQGKTPRDMIDELGLDETEIQDRMREIRQEHLKEQLQILVDQGVITQAQADARLQFMASHQANLGQGKGMFGQMRASRGGNKGMGFHFAQ